MVMSLSRVLWKVRSKAPTVTASVKGTVLATGEGYTTIRDSTRTIAAYRDRYGVTGLAPLGARAETETQKLDAARARAALDRAQNLAQPEQPEQERARRTGPQRVRPSL